MLKRRRFNASMTVEAAFVLPFFLFAFLNIISVVEIYRLQSNMSAAMHSTAKQMAAHGYEYEAVPSAALTLFASGKVKNILKDEYFETSPVIKDYGSINWMWSKIMGEDDCIDLVAVYQVKPASDIMGFCKFRMYNRMRTRSWTGYDNADNRLFENSKEEIVYITEHGEVYHRSRSCTHIKLSIDAVDMSFLKNARNAGGEKYYPCENCGNTNKSTVFITDYGNRYHSTLRCSGLKRTVKAVPISQVGGRGACSKCGG